MRQAVVALLQKQGAKVESLRGGSGVPPFSRILVKTEGAVLKCAIKTTQGGRIHFERNPDGRFKVLSDVDRVIHVQPTSQDRNMLLVRMFDQKTVLAAFEENCRALAKHGMAHLPAWINPQFEGGWRLAGSGFEKKALWAEIVPLDVSVPELPETVKTEMSGVVKRSRGMTIQEAKEALANTFGVSPDKIEILVRG
jgi:hypothetical protein